MNYLLFTKFFQQNILTHELQFLSSGCKSVDGLHPGLCCWIRKRMLSTEISLK